MLKADPRPADLTDVASCVRHPMAISTEVCRRCGHGFCSECVVYPFGVAKGAMCISCALEAGGVSRQKTGRPKLSTKEIRSACRRTAHGLDRDPGHEAGCRMRNPRNELDQAWLNGEVDAETLGGWSRTF